MVIQTISTGFPGLWRRAHGASLLSLCPESGVGGYRPEKRKISINPLAKESNTNRTNWDFPFFRPAGLLRPLGVDFGGGTGGVNIDKFGKVFFKKMGRIWSYRALVKAILHRILRPIIWAWSRGQGFEGGEETLDFLTC